MGTWSLADTFFECLKMYHPGNTEVQAKWNKTLKKRSSNYRHLYC